MKPLTVEEIRRAVHARRRSRGDDLTARGVSTDSRSAEPGDAFFALRGERCDGHDFLSAAAERGCVAAVTDMAVELEGAVLDAFPAGVLGVPDTTRALGELGAWHRGGCGATVVAVTGSNGKTTVKRMIHHVLSRTLTGTCSPKSFNNAIGVPLTLLAADTGDDYTVCELGTSAPGEIAALAGMCSPDIAVITSVAPAHLERLGSIERIAAEKASILGPLSPDGLAVVWADSDVLRKTVAGYDRRMVLFGTAEDAALRVTAHQPQGPRQRFQLNGRLWVELPMPGRHNAANALAAIAVARRFGIDEADAAAALADFAGTDMRLAWERLPDGTLIDDAYNANPASLAAAVDVLRACPGRRRVLIVGDMLELGETADALHAAAGRGAAAAGIDVVVAVGPLAKSLAAGAAEGGASTSCHADAGAAAEAIGEAVRPGDAVLVKGSRGMAMERLLPAVRRVLGGGDGKGHGA